MTNLRVIDTETGEDLSLEYTLRHRNQDSYYKQRLAQRSRQRDFTFSNMLNMAEVITKIDDKYCGYLLYLQTYINYDGVLVNATHEKEPMTKEDIQSALNLKKTAFYEFFKNMTDNEIMFEENGDYRINPIYHFRGSTDNTRVVKTFTAKVRSLYSVRNAKKLGFIYKLLPYIHYETNTICNNPYETNLKCVEQLSKNDIAELTQVSEKSVYSYLRSMKLGDEYVFAEIKTGKVCYYKINPFIFYRKNGEPDASLREIFLLGFSHR